MSIYCCWTSLQQTSFLFRCQCLTLVIKSTSYLICIQSEVSIPHRPAKRGKWRKCHLQKLLVCAEVSQHEHDKKREYMLISADFWILFKIHGLVEITITTNIRKRSLDFRQFCFLFNFLTVHRFFHRTYNMVGCLI